MKVGMRCCYVVSRPPAKFHRIRSPFDAPTDNYSGSIAGQTSDVFGLRKQSPGLSMSSLLSARDHLHSPLPTAEPNLTSLVRPPPHPRASESCPEPDPDCRHRCVRIIPKHLQNVSVFFCGLPNLFFSQPSILDRRASISLLLDPLAL